MCLDPATAAAVALGGKIVGKVAGAGGKVLSAINARRQARFQQQIFDKQAADERSAALAEEERLRIQASAALGDQAVNLAAQGSRIDEGSPLLLQVQSAENLRADQLLVRFGGATRARTATDRGILARREGEAQFTSGIFGAAGDLLELGTGLAGGTL